VRIVIEIPRSGRRLGALRRLVVEWARAVGADADDLPLVTTELVANALEASPADDPVVVRLEREGSRVRVVVIDDGPGFEVGALDLPPPDAARGRGLALVAQMVDSVHVERVDGHTIVTACTGATSPLDAGEPAEA
jgi:anti-sigma regulatory factor (Ser/Thr protein kinase)